MVFSDGLDRCAGSGAEGQPVVRIPFLMPGSLAVVNYELSAESLCIPPGFCALFLSIVVVDF